MTSQQVRKIAMWVRIVWMLAFVLAPFLPQGAFAGSDVAGGLGDMLANITSVLKGAALAFAVLGVVIFGLSLLVPANIFQTIGLNIQNDYLIKLAFGALLIGGASEIASFFFGGGLTGEGGGGGGGGAALSAQLFWGV
jgi:hypothetical protein